MKIQVNYFSITVPKIKIFNVHKSFKPYVKMWGEGRWWNVYL